MSFRNLCAAFPELDAAFSGWGVGTGGSNGAGCGGDILTIRNALWACTLKHAREQAKKNHKAKNQAKAYTPQRLVKGL
jgi:hypothetical protein